MAEITNVRLFVTRIRYAPHYFLSGALAIAILPCFKFVHLPFSINWQRLVPLFWVGLAERALLASVILAAIGLPANITVKPLCRHFMAQKARLFFFAAFAAWAFWKFHFHAGLILIAIAVVLTELIDRSQGNLRTIGRWIGSVIPPAIYFFLGLVLVF